jgi:RNA polymerase sigma factor (sigma-70 family)
MPLPEQSSVQVGIGLVNPTTTPSQKIVRREMEEQVRKVMQSLSESDRDILMMHHADNLTYREIGQILSITTNAATLRYAKALLHLRSLWNKACGKAE